MRIISTLLFAISTLAANAQAPLVAATGPLLTSAQLATDTASIRRVINQNRDIVSRMAKVEVKLHQDEAIKVQSESTLYKMNKRRATATLNTIDAAEACYDILLKSTIQAGNQNVLASISNPESGALGFRLADVISEKINLQLTKNSLLVDKDRDKFVAGLSTLIGTVGALLNPTSLVVQTVQSIANFLPGRVKDAAKDPDGKLFAQRFVNDMQPYLLFYDKLQKENDAYGTSLSRLESKYRSLGFELSDLTKENAKHRILAQRSAADNIDDIFESSAAGQFNFNYEAKNQDDDVLYLSDINSDVYSLTKQVLEFHREYSEIINKHFRESLALLEEAKTQFPGNNSTIDRTKKLIVLPEADPTGFTKLLTTINNNLDGMRTRRAAVATNQVSVPMPPRPPAPQARLKGVSPR